MTEMLPSSTAVSRNQNQRHEIDPALVRAQVDRKVAHYEQQRIERKQQAQQSLEEYERTDLDRRAARWSARPQGPEQVDAMYARWIECEKDYYARVRVIELPGDSKKRFILVYGDTDDATVTSGTGPFESFDLAADWFLKSGR
jgi:hypothetical protein